MALPKINNLPSYRMTIPSLKQEVSYRPFLVGEQKVLLMALESNDDIQVLDAIVNIIDSCIHDSVAIDRLTSFDIEYCFIKIRSASVGETADVNVACSSCNEFTPVHIDLNKIEIELNEQDKTIPLTDQFTLVMRYPNYKGLIHANQSLEELTATSTLYEMVLLCMDELRTEDEIIKFDDELQKDKEEFLAGLTSNQFKSIMTFVNNIPKLQHDINFDCKHCNHHNNTTLEGLQDFF